MIISVMRTLFCVFVLFFSVHLYACDTCRSVGTIETRAECKMCRGHGTIIQKKSAQCTACCGSGRSSYGGGSSVYGAHKTGSFCRPCRGTGHVVTSSTVPCESCGGQGVIVSRVSCPKCGGRSGGTQVASSPSSDMPAASTAGSVASSVQTAKIETCTLCGPNGSVEKTTVCELCEKGYCHKKISEGGKDVFKCRNCGKVCEGRFVPCACGKPDCQQCDGKCRRVETNICELCGGDKIITPLEREKARTKTEAK